MVDVMSCQIASREQYLLQQLGAEPDEVGVVGARRRQAVQLPLPPPAHQQRRGAAQPRQPHRAVAAQQHVRRADASARREIGSHLERDIYLQQRHKTINKNNEKNM